MNVEIGTEATHTQFLFWEYVKTATRTHNNEYGQALMLTGFIHVTSYCFSLLGHWTRESTSRNLRQRFDTPIMQQGELR